MAYDAFAQLLKCKNTTGTDQVELHADLQGKGQNDATAKEDLPAGCDPKEWFRVLHAGFECVAAANTATGTSAGGLTESTLRIVREVGSLSPMMAETCAARAIFDLHLKLMMAGKGTSKTHEMRSEVKLFRASLKSIRFFTGDHAFGSSMTSLGSRQSDTRELEELIIIYQSAEFNYDNKDGSVGKAKWSMSGRTK